jgi:hypothetical protein
MYIVVQTNSDHLTAVEYPMLYRSQLPLASIKLGETLDVEVMAPRSRDRSPGSRENQLERELAISHHRSSEAKSRRSQGVVAG